MILNASPTLDVGLASATQKYDALTNPRVLTSPISLTELLTLEGDRFYSEADLVYGAGVTKYFLYQMPSVAADKTIGLQNRRFKSLNGEATLEILWNTTGGDIGVALPSFNENRNTAIAATMVINELDSVPIGGIVRESDFVTGSGQGVNSSGDVSPAVGFRLYSPDSFFIAKVTNTHNANNRIHLAYSWFEVTTSAI